MLRIKNFANNHPVAKKVAINIFWLFSDKVLRMGVGVIVVIWLARYLGAEQFGLLNFTSALVTVFGAIAALGLNGIVVRDLVNKPDQALQILGTAFILRLSAAVLAYTALILTIFLLRPDDSLSRTLIVILGLGLLFKSAEVVKYWFESKVQSKYAVWVENSSFLFVSTIKVIMLWRQASLVAFAYVMLLESALVAVALFYIYSKTEISPIHWQATKSRAISLLNDSWPLIISSAAWFVHTRLDQIMIGQMLDDKAVGYYSSAIRLSELVNFLPTIIAFSIIPAITKLRETNRDLYLKRFQIIYDIAVGMTLIAALVTTMLSDRFIHLLFGAEYAPAAPVLTISIWSSIFIAMATVSGRYMINEGLQRITMQRHLLGVLLNIPLNLLLIPAYGIEGAAIASLVALAAANYFYDAFSPSTIICFRQKTKSILMTEIIKHGLKHTKNRTTTWFR